MTAVIIFMTPDCISFHDVRDEISYIVQNRYFVYEIMTAAMTETLRSGLTTVFLTFFFLYTLRHDFAPLVMKYLVYLVMSSLRWS